MRSIDNIGFMIAFFFIKFSSVLTKFSIKKWFIQVSISGKIPVWVKHGSKAIRTRFWFKFA